MGNRFLKYPDPRDDNGPADPDVRDPDVVPDPCEDYPKPKRRPQHELDADESY